VIPHALAGYLVNAAWQAPVVALCALILTRFGGLSPGGRNRLWLGFLALAVILPAVALGDILPRALPVVARTPAAPPIVAPLAPAESLATLPSDLPATATAPAMVLAPWSAWLMVGLLAIVAGLLLVRLAVAARAARRLVAESRPVLLPASVNQALEALARHHGRAVPPVRRSHAVRSPAVVGALRPTILIPDSLEATDDDLRAALLHELAHVLRHDYAVNLACELLTLPVAWHPATLALKAGVRHSRELACDAMAAAAMTSQKTYARCLVSLAQTLGAGANAPSTRAALAVGLFGRGGLEDRLMQLMKPRDDEAPAVRAARLCGLAALGAGLLGSAALLHVTPVFAQAPAAVRAPLAAPAPVAGPATAVAAQAAADAGKSATPVHRRHGLIYSKKGVLIEVGDQGYRHSFTAANGKTITVVNDEPAAPSAEQQREWEAEARAAEEQAEKAEAMVNSPEFKARIERAKAAGEAARRMTESPEFKARIAKATADAAKAAAVVDSPAFKAHIARIKADGEAIGKLMDTPEYRARIEAARASGEAARAMVESAEFKAQMAQMREDAAAMRRDMAAFREQQRGGPGPTP
jgi:beta-lactamase regulating signal transducer with metallopeptidase domain